MAVLLLLVLFRIVAEIVVGHEGEAEPGGEHEDDPPRQYDGPEDPVGHPQNQMDFALGVVAQDVSGPDAPGESDGPDNHDEQAFAPSMAQELLLLVGRTGHGEKPTGG